MIKFHREFWIRLWREAERGTVEKSRSLITNVGKVYESVSRYVCSTIDPIHTGLFLQIACRSGIYPSRMFQIWHTRVDFKYFGCILKRAKIHPTWVVIVNRHRPKSKIHEMCHEGGNVAVGKRGLVVGYGHFLIFYSINFSLHPRSFLLIEVR